jgi:hypothetical protein
MKKLLITTAVLNQPPARIRSPSPPTPMRVVHS